MCDLDSADVTSRISRADVILIDVRGGMPRFLEDAVLGSQARVVVPLIGPAPYLRLGNLSGDTIAKRQKRFPAFNVCE